MSTTPSATGVSGRLRRHLPALDVVVAAHLHVVVGAVVAFASVLVDQATKHWADVALTRGAYVPVLGDRFGWQLTFNDGGAWGFPAPSWFFLAVTVVVVVIVVRNLPLVTGGRGATAYGLLLSGAVGNALDRVFRTGDPGDPRFLFGHVVDFVAVELPTWLGPLGGAFPRFNVADVAITVGFVLLAWDLLREPHEPEVDEAAPEATDDEDDQDTGGDAPGPSASLPVTVA